MLITLACIQTHFICAIAYCVVSVLWCFPFGEKLYSNGRINDDIMRVRIDSLV